MFRRLDMSLATDLCYEASVFREVICMAHVVCYHLGAGPRSAIGRAPDS